MIVLKWIFGIVCFLFALITFSSSIIAAFLFLIAGAFLIPPIFDKINSGGKINPTFKIGIPILGFFAGFLIFGASTSAEVDKSIAKIKVKQKEENVNLTQEQKDSIKTIERERISDSLKIAKIQNEAELKLQNEIENRKNNTISATDLHNFFDENEVSAEIKFKGKKIYVEGVVESVGKDSKGMSVSLKASSFMTTLLGYVNDGERGVIANLKKGDRITLYGFCDNFDWGIVTMKGCEVLENLK
tara:strand:- start:413 stop:1144 length:732 start_codon:yes stop_codon:yes gene_type:complete